MAVSNMFGEHAMCVIFVIIEERPSWLLQIVKYHATCTLLYCADHDIHVIVIVSHMTCML